MTTAVQQKLLLLLALGLLSGCVAYNDPCAPLVDNPGERVAFIMKGTELWLDRPNARHTNNAIGQLDADATVWVFRDTDKPVQLAVMNGGAIRAEGLCVTRNILGSGPLSNGVLHEILLFENPVNAVDLSEQELRDMFEHSVEKLFPTASPIVSPAGSFLQVSQEVSMDVDCALAPLSRVVRLRVNNVDVQKPARPFSEVKYRVAMPAFLLGGGDGYTMLAGKGTDPSRNPTQAQRFGGIDSNITAAYLKQSAFNATVEAGFQVESRVKLANCAAPVRPPN